MSKVVMYRPPVIQSLLLAAFVLASCSTPRSSPGAAPLLLGDDQLYYESSGEGSPLVFVSGGSGMDLTQWKRVAPELANDFQVILFDPRGIGRSDNPTARYSDTEDIAALLDHLGLERAVLIGLSSSGGIVLEFAARYPDRVVGVVAAAPFVPGFVFSEAMLARLNVFSSAAQEGREPFLNAMFDDPHFIPAPLDATVRPIARANMAGNFEKGAGFDVSLPIPVSPPLIEQLSVIESPVLLVVGELDHPEVLRRNRFLVEEIPLAREAIVIRAGHNIPLENPPGFLEAVEPFLLKMTSPEWSDR